MSRLLVTLCTYNERENIARLVPEIHRCVPHADVLIVDDSSPDGTGVLADEMASNDHRVRVLHRQGKLGLGSATVAAFRYGLAESYELLVNMDADFSHPPAQIPVLIGLMDSADVAIGSRYVPGGEIIGWKPIRHVMSRGVNLLSRTCLGLTPRDTSGSFRCYRVELLRRIDFDRIIAKGYAFEEEILFRCRRVGARFVETPIRFEDRRAGSSKINAREVATALRDLGLLSLENLRSPAAKPLEPVTSTSESGVSGR
ncbi:MAG: polyprenol monophosphomannose synthase [Planctomycetota bacterium]|nr:polyprenol monophosphomannose synthase [Planctomycetota bacterium]